jgi:hypothetical protein
MPTFSIDVIRRNDTKKIAIDTPQFSNIFFQLSLGQSGLRFFKMCFVSSKMITVSLEIKNPGFLLVH